MAKRFYKTWIVIESEDEQIFNDLETRMVNAIAIVFEGSGIPCKVINIDESGEEPQHSPSYKEPDTTELHAG